MHESKIAICLLFLFFLLSSFAVWQKSLTADEIIHIPAGLSYIKTLDFRLNPEHPPLMKILAGIFMLPLNPKLPVEHESWEKNDQYKFGEVFFFDVNQDKHDLLLFFARLPMILVGMLLGWVIYQWSSEAFGKTAGLLSLALYTLEPNFLAHSALVTTDVGVAAFLTLSAYLFWKWLKNPHYNLKTITKIGAVFGLTLVAKFTGIYLIPVIAALFLLHLINSRFKVPLFKQVAACTAMFLIAIIVASAFYGFWEAGTYVEGLKRVMRESGEGRNSFLYGEYGRGWWYYFPLAFVVKMPIPTMLILLLAAILLCRTEKDRWFDIACILLPAGLLFGVFMLNKINIGFRHVLPSLPFLFVFSGSVVRHRLLVNKTDVTKIAAFILIIWLAVETAIIYPDFLAYFNQFSGGPENGYNYLMDSNIDWGQDLKGLKQWIKEKNIDKVTLGYFGQDNPYFREINHDKLKCYETTGYLAVSVNILNGFRLEDRTCTEWLRKYEPVDNVGHSMLIYKIETAASKQEGMQEYCEKGCVVRCDKQNKTAQIAVVVERKCVCECD